MNDTRRNGYQTSTATVVEAPPAKADLRSILQNGTDGDAATFEGGLKGLFRVRKVGDIPWSLPPSGKSFHCSQLLLRQKQPRVEFEVQEYISTLPVFYLRFEAWVEREEEIFHGRLASVLEADLEVDLGQLCGEVDVPVHRLDHQVWGHRVGATQGGPQEPHHQ